MLKPSTSKFSAITIATLCLLNAAHAGELVVEVKNVTKDGGKVLVALFNRAEGFPRKGYLHGESLEPGCGPLSAVFHDVPDGTYAVTAYHDVDANNKLNTNNFGIPTEPVAFSNNASSSMYGPPTYVDASFKVAGPTTKIAVTLK